MILTSTSCQVRVVAPYKPLQKNSIELYKNYTIQTSDAKIFKMEVLKQDDAKIYGKTKRGEQVVLDKSEIRVVKKLDLFSTIAIGLASVAAVLFIPM